MFGVQFGPLSTGWGAPQFIQGEGADGFEQVIAAGADGTVVVVWQEWGAGVDLVAAVFTPGQGWGAPTSIDGTDDDLWGPVVAVDDAGTAMVVWEQFGIADMGIMSNRYVPGVGWTGVEVVATGGGPQQPTLATHGSDKFTLGWIDTDGVSNDVHVGDYTAGAGWQTLDTFDITDNNPSWPRIAADGAGRSMVVWEETDDGGTPSIWSSYRAAGGAWGVPELVEQSGLDTHWPQIAMSPGGKTWVVGVEVDGEFENLWANQFVPGTGWGTKGLIESGRRSQHRSAAGGGFGGNSIVVWEQVAAAGNEVLLARYTTAGGWQAEDTLVDAAGLTFLPGVAVSPNGRAIASWGYFDETAIVPVDSVMVEEFR